ncbi:phosphotransferase family protein [Thalassobaculum litoreum]|uniref:Predicted kinase, aminoglycoside phosphotransferase (APT) family n=1 Tax=Thalassobaculum litoreum DSM 18839 TaxID=1123362 RepID=A0A8G2BFB2_9PROT|nr:phosphotransferase family protein [Thalassobaculum litoreum]SDF18746.1 Predicted kinase, aminoglycoside phosphotransferase (APT) family [Thalassobaculum litoreum DSM 18839]
MTPEQIDALAVWTADRLGAGTVTLSPPSKMSGGAIQENWKLDAEVVDGPHAGSHALVLRTDAPSGVSVSHPRAHEFALLRAAFAAGATVPEPLALDEGGAVLGKPFYLMRRATGTANPRALSRDTGLDPHRPALTAAIGRELARIHSITPPRAELAFLPQDPRPPVERRLDEFRAQLDALPRAYPALEWAIRWLEMNAPASAATVLGHGDFRCGNIMADGAEVTAVLDWEFAGWSDPMEDVGWICARCWRFGVDDRVVGGIGDLSDFRLGYEAEAGHGLDWGRVGFWEVLATVRWAIIALHQGERHLSGEEMSMELALTGRKAAEMEFDVLTQIRAIETGKMERMS